MAGTAEPMIAVRPAGVSVYGVAQNAYFVEEAGGRAATDYDLAIVAASLRRSTSIEASMSAASDIVRIKQRKLQDMTDLLALLTQARANLKTKNPDVSDVGSAPGLKAKAELVKANYGVDIYYWGDKHHVPRGDDGITRECVEGAFVVLQSEIDKTDNQLQQDMLTLQSWMSKRDESYRSAAKAMKKILGTSKATIGNIGG